MKLDLAIEIIRTELESACEEFYPNYERDDLCDDNNNDTDVNDKLSLGMDIVYNTLTSELFKESDAYFNPTAIRTSYIGFAEGNPKFHIINPNNHKQYIIIFII